MRFSRTSFDGTFFPLLFQDIVLYLLENGADIDMFNNHNNTPFFLATESLHKEICQVRAYVLACQKRSRVLDRLLKLNNIYANGPQCQGKPTSIFGNYLFGRRFEILNFRNICCNIPCLPACPRIFEHLKPFLTDFYRKKVT